MLGGTIIKTIKQSRPAPAPAAKRASCSPNLCQSSGMRTKPSEASEPTTHAARQDARIQKSKGAEGPGSCLWNGSETGEGCRARQIHPHGGDVRPTGVKPINLVLLCDSKSPCCDSRKIDGWLFRLHPAPRCLGNQISDEQGEEIKTAFRLLRFSVTARRERRGGHSPCLAARLLALGLHCIFDKGIKAAAAPKPFRPVFGQPLPGAWGALLGRPVASGH